MNTEHLQWIELDLAALSHNLKQFRALVGPERKVLAMVKANAYGHGMSQVAALALAEGADWLGVHSLEEGISLRGQGIRTPILISGYVALSDLEEAVVHGLRLTVYNPETIERLGRLCQDRRLQAYVHIKLETGTHRQGVDPGKLGAMIEQLRLYPGIVLEGISSHFADIEDTTDHTYARRQLDSFTHALAELEKQDLRVPIRHMSCTAAAILLPETHFDMLRIGIGLYGMWPSKETYVSCLQQDREPLELKPVLAWKARIAQVKSIPQGAFVGYGRSFRATRATRLAVIPIGYSDGYPRHLSNIAHVLIEGQRAPLRGRVAMNFITADITDIPAAGLEDPVVLLGRSQTDQVTADMLASWAGTINYEIVARLSPNIPRIVRASRPAD
ncbi:MAG: alanine racemase [Candidatus Aminicenantaceae bacterium]